MNAIKRLLFQFVWLWLNNVKQFCEILDCLLEPLNWIRKQLFGLWALLWWSNLKALFPQRKKLSLKPHERHVANKRRRSTIFDTHGGNYSLPNISPVAVVSIKGSPQQEPEEAKITPVHHTMEKKKRRRRKKQKKRTSKKMKDEPKAYSRVVVSNYSQILMNCLLWRNFFG